MGSQTVVADVCSIPRRTGRDTRDLRGQCGRQDKPIHSSNTSKNLRNMHMTSLRYICISQGPVRRTEPMTGSRGYLLWTWVREVLEEFTKGER